MINIRELVDKDGTLRIPVFLNIGAMENSQGLIYQLQIVGHNTFDGLQELKKLIIPATITNIEWCFYHCYNLAEFEVEDDNPIYCSIDGVLFTKDRKKLVAYSNAHGSEYTVPEGVEEVMHFAFKSCRSIRTVRLPASVRKISINAFYECAALKYVYLPDNFEVMEKCTNNANIRCEFIHKGRQYSYEEAIVKFKE